MKVVIEYQERTTLAKFADKYNLVLKVRERDGLSSTSVRPLPRFWASFEHSETKEGSFLIGTYGNGDSISEAIADYTKELSGKLLVIYTMDKKKRQEIQVPILNKKKGR